MEYISLATDAEPTNVAQFAKLIGPVAEDAYMTAAEKLAKQGGEKGRKEGQVELLLRLLTLRFGAVPDSVSKRVRRASDCEVNLWAERVLSAPSLEAVFAKP